MVGSQPGGAGPPSRVNTGDYIHTHTHTRAIDTYIQYGRERKRHEKSSVSERRKGGSTGINDILRALGLVEAVLKPSDQAVTVERQQVTHRHLALLPLQPDEVQRHVPTLRARLHYGLEPDINHSTQQQQ